MSDIATAQAIVHNIRLNHAFEADLSVPFKTQQTTGFIPKEHLQTYLDTGLFMFDENVGAMRFSSKVNGFHAKTEAMRTVTDSLITAGLITASSEPHFQERAVGGPLRTRSEKDAEFKVNRAYFRYFGLPADGVFLNITLNAAKDGAALLLQQRAADIEAANTYDFAAGGAVKWPQRIEDAVQAQAIEEIGFKFTDARYMGSTSFRFSTEPKKWVTNMDHHLYSLSKKAVAIGQFDTVEVQGFRQATVEETLSFAANGQFNRQNTQALMTSLVKQGMLPAFNGSKLIMDEVAKHTLTPPAAQVARLRL